MSSQVEHTDVGAYALGLLEDADRRAFEAHLDGCEVCAAELREMSGMADTLSGIGAFLEANDEANDEADADEDGGSAGGPGGEGPPAPVVEMSRRRAERRFRRGTYIIGAAAAAVLLATGMTIGSAIGGESPGSGPKGGHGGHGPAMALVIWGERHQAANAGTGASGVVGLESKGWGTHVGLELRGVKGPLNCHLEAVSRTGERSVVTGWRVPAKGYGVPGSPDPLITHGGTGILRGDLSRFEVVVDGGGPTLLSIPL